MKESASESLIHFGLNFGFTFFFFGILYGVVSCILKCYSRDDQIHYHDNNNDDHVNITITRHVGLKPYILRSIPIIEFNSKDFKDGVECVVCLSELVDGAKARVLPSCNHCFHVECIDSWFRSHSTCPICRKRVCFELRGTGPEFGGGDENSTQNHDPSPEHRGIPTDSSPRSTDTAVVEDADCGGANEGPPDLTAVVIDIPAKEISSPRSTDAAVVEDADCGGANEGPPDLTAVVVDIPAEEISSPRSTDAAVVEDADCGGANEGPLDLTAVVVDIPAQEIKSGPC